MTRDTSTATLHEHAGIRLDPAQRTATVAGRQLLFTDTQFRLLACLVREPGRVFTRTQLMAAAISGGAIVLERTIDVHISALRRKLGPSARIETVRRLGYRFRSDQEGPLPGEVS